MPEHPAAGRSPHTVYDEGRAWTFDSTTASLASVVAAITFTPISADPLLLKISENPGGFDFEWNSQAGKLYDLLTSTDLATPVSQWPVYDDGENLWNA